MASKTKKNRKNKKTTKPSRSLTSLIFFGTARSIIQIAKGLWRLLTYLVVTASRQSKQRPLAAVGLCAFFLIFAFVGMNALFQSQEWNVSQKNNNIIPEADPLLLETQRELAAIGLYDGKIDGLGGPKTWEAVESWQKLRQSLERGKEADKDDALAKIIRDFGN